MAPSSDIGQTGNESAPLDSGRVQNSADIQNFAEAVRTAASGYVDRRKSDVAQAIADVAASIREATAPLDSRPNVNAFVQAAAEGIDQLAGTLQSRPGAAIVNDFEDVLRRHSTAIALGAVAAGLLAAGYIVSRNRDPRTRREPVLGSTAGIGDPPYDRSA
jgi:hypothetical protein